MNEKIKKEIDRFLATSEDGEKFIIITSQVFIIDESFQEIPSIKSSATIDGLTVNVKSNNQYECEKPI